MNKIEKLMAEFPKFDYEFAPLKIKLGGLALGNEITINSNRSREKQYQWLLEELGHLETSVGDITDYSSPQDMKQEVQARRWGYKHCFSREDIECIKKEHPDNDYEVADELGVQVPYLHEVGITYGLDFKHVRD